MLKRQASTGYHDSDFMDECSSIGSIPLDEKSDDESPQNDVISEDSYKRQSSEKFENIVNEETKHENETVEEQDWVSREISTLASPSEPKESEKYALKRLIENKLGFFKIKEWDTDRRTRYRNLVDLSDLVIKEMKSVVDHVYALSNMILRLLTDRSKMDAEYSRQLKLLMHFVDLANHDTVLKGINLISHDNNNDENLVANSNAQESDTPKDVNSSSETPDDQLNSNILSKSRPLKSKSKSNEDIGNISSDENRLASHNVLNFTSSNLTKSWMESIFKFNENTAMQFEAYNPLCDNNASNDIPDLNTMFIENLKIWKKQIEFTKKCRYQLKKAFQSCNQSWSQYESVFNESIQSNLSDVPSHKQRCCWLVERNYVTTLHNFHILQQLYLQNVISNLEKLRDMEASRCGRLRQMLYSYFNKCHKSFSILQDTVVEALGLIDIKQDNASNHSGLENKQQNAYLGSGNYYHQRLHQNDHNSYRFPFTNQSIDSIASDKSFVLEYPKPQEIQRPNSGCYNSNSNPSSSFPSWMRNMAIDLGISLCGIENIVDKLFLQKLFCQLRYPKIPNTQFIIRRSKVKRLSGVGLFSKWLDGILVLTWNRFLHMFKNPDDMKPVWSTPLASMEIRHYQEKGNNDEWIIEIRDKKKSILSSRPFCFQVSNEENCNIWINILNKSIMETNPTLSEYDKLKEINDEKLSNIENLKSLLNDNDCNSNFYKDTFDASTPEATSPNEKLSEMSCYYTNVLYSDEPIGTPLGIAEHSYFWSDSFSSSPSSIQKEVLYENPFEPYLDNTTI